MLDIPLVFSTRVCRFLVSAIITENQSSKRFPIAVNCCGLHSVLDGFGYSKKFNDKYLIEKNVIYLFFILNHNGKLAQVANRVEFLDRPSPTNGRIVG